MTTQQDAYLDGMSNYDALEHQVNNVIAANADNIPTDNYFIKFPLYLFYD